MDLEKALQDAASSMDMLDNLLQKQQEMRKLQEGFEFNAMSEKSSRRKLQLNNDASTTTSIAQFLSSSSKPINKANNTLLSSMSLSLSKQIKPSRQSCCSDDLNRSFMNHEYANALNAFIDRGTRINDATSLLFKKQTTLTDFMKENKISPFHNTLNRVKPVDLLPSSRHQSHILGDGDHTIDDISMDENEVDSVECENEKQSLSLGSSASHESFNSYNKLTRSELEDHSGITSPPETSLATANASTFLPSQSDILQKRNAASNVPKAAFPEWVKSRINSSIMQSSVSSQSRQMQGIFI